jgi:aryl-alcohol dehydrogenase-like predicted oxidoreductase
MTFPPQSTNSFSHATLGRTGRRVLRLGLSATYRPGAETILHARDQGVHVFFAYGFDTQMVQAMREILPRDRESTVLVTGAYNLIVGYPSLRRTLERRLRQFRTEYVDVFLFLGVMKEKEFPPRARDELRRLREEGKVKAIGVSTHDRKFAGRLAASGDLDVLMVRYNAAHRGAERDIFPHLSRHDPGIISYTATRWRSLLRRPRSWPPGDPTPGAGQLYRFVLSNPHVDVCLAAPRSRRELDEDLAAIEAGPLTPGEMESVARFGDAVYAGGKAFR